MTVATKQMPDLTQFIGTEHKYRHGLLRSLLYTDGVHYMCDEVGAHWFVDLIASYQFKPRVRREPFQIWRIKLDGKGGCVVTMWRDTPQPGEKAIVTQRIEYTDFPADFECYCIRGDDGLTVMLKSEY